MARDARPRNQAHLGRAASKPQEVRWANLNSKCQFCEKRLHGQEKESDWCKCSDGYEPKTCKFIPHIHWDKVCFEHGPSPLCASGGYGSTKTHCLSLKALYLSDVYPNNRGV